MMKSLDEFMGTKQQESTIWVDGENITNCDYALIDKKTHKLTLVSSSGPKTYPKPVIAVFHFPSYLNDRVDFITDQEHLEKIKELDKRRGYNELISIDKEIKEENPYRAMMRQIQAP